MKKFYMTMVAMLCGVAAMAQENFLYIEDVTVKPGETVMVPVCMKNTADYITRIQMAFGEFPEGVVFGDDEDEYEMAEDRLDLEGARLAAKKPTGKLEKMFKFEWAGKWLMFASAAASYKDDDGNTVNVAFLGNDGPVFSIPFTAAETAVEGSYTVPLTYKLIGFNPENVDEAIGVTGVEPIESSFVLNVGDGTGINSINANDSNAPIYNVAGQRVSKAQKGVFIQNGKKVAVK